MNNSKAYITTVGLGFVFVLAALFNAVAEDPTQPLMNSPVIIDYFFEPGCSECIRVDSEVIPELRERYEGYYVLNKWDIGIENHYLKLVAYMEKLGVHDNAYVFMVINGKDVLAGVDAIATRLFPMMDEHLSMHFGDSATLDSAVSVSRPDGRELAAKRIKRFTLVGVLIGGLVDGINPCVIATLVFLISVMSTSHISGRNILIVGSSFCLASFLTYTAIGFGLLHALHALSCFQMIRRTVDFILVAILMVFAYYSFLDAFRFRKTRKAKDVTLRLPEKITLTIHRILRVGLKKRAQAASAFTIGVAVTALESVCTGQVYVPTLALVVKSRVAVSRGLFFLLIYNLMFIVPLVVVFILSYHGTRLAKLSEWSAKNVFVSKLLLGSFFVALAAVIIIMD